MAQSKKGREYIKNVNIWSESVNDEKKSDTMNS